MRDCDASTFSEGHLERLTGRNEFGNGYRWSELKVNFSFMYDTSLIGATCEVARVLRHFTAKSIVVEIIFIAFDFSWKKILKHDYG